MDSILILSARLIKLVHSFPVLEGCFFFFLLLIFFLGFVFLDGGVPEGLISGFDSQNCLFHTVAPIQSFHLLFHTTKITSALLTSAQFILFVAKGRSYVELYSHRQVQLEDVRVHPLRHIYFTESQN